MFVLNEESQQEELPVCSPIFFKLLTYIKNKTISISIISVMAYNSMKKINFLEKLKSVIQIFLRIIFEKQAF